MDVTSILAGPAAVIQAELDALYAQRDSDRTMIAGQQETISTQAARIKALEAELRGPTIFGTSRPTGLVPAVRHYFTPAQTATQPTHLTPSPTASFDACPPDGLVWVSFKGAGPWLASWLDDARAKYPEKRIYVTVFHEPKEFYSGGTMAKAWLDAQATLEAIVDGRENVTAGTIVESGPPDDAYWGAVLRDKQEFWLDSYNYGLGARNKRYADPAEVHGPRIQWVLDHGKTSTAIGETGTGVVPGDTDRSGQTGWVKANRDYLAGEPVTAAQWWNSGNGGPLGTGCQLTPEQLNVWLSRG